MDALIPEIKKWLSAGKKVALATVVQTWGSSPRPPGSSMAVSADQQLAGSVSGGCVEGAVVEASLEVLRTGEPTRLHFGVSDDRAWEVGLACGGELDVFVREMDPRWIEIWESAREREEPFCQLLVMEGPAQLVGRQWIQMADGTVFSAEVPPKEVERMGKLTRQALSEGRSRQISMADPDHPERMKHAYFLQIEASPSSLVIVGAGHITIPLVQIARVMGFQSTVVDPRRLFASTERFPAVKNLLQVWPEEAFSRLKINRQTAVVVLTHDPKIDDPAIIQALQTEAFYIGALGSKRTHKKRAQRLRDAGIPGERIQSIHAPIGLDLGGNSAEEIALAIMAEVVKVQHQSD